VPLAHAKDYVYTLEDVKGFKSKMITEVDKFREERRQNEDLVP